MNRNNPNSWSFTLRQIFRLFYCSRKMFVWDTLLLFQPRPRLPNQIFAFRLLAHSPLWVHLLCWYPITSYVLSELDKLISYNIVSYHMGFRKFFLSSRLSTQAGYCYLNLFYWLALTALSNRNVWPSLLFFLFLISGVVVRKFSNLNCITLVERFDSVQLLFKCARKFRQDSKTEQFYTFNDYLALFAKGHRTHQAETFEIPSKTCCIVKFPRERSLRKFKVCLISADLLSFVSCYPGRLLAVFCETFMRDNHVYVGVD